MCLSTALIQKMYKHNTFIFLFSIKCWGTIRVQLLLRKRNRASRGRQWDEYGVITSQESQIQNWLHNVTSFLLVTHSFPSSCTIFSWDSTRFFWVSCSFTSMPSCLAIMLYTTEISVLGNENLFRSPQFQKTHLRYHSPASWFLFCFSVSSTQGLEFSNSSGYYLQKTE